MIKKSKYELLLEEADDQLNAFNPEDEPTFTMRRIAEALGYVYTGLKKRYCTGPSAEIRFNDEIIANQDRLTCGILGKNTMNCVWYEGILEDAKAEAIQLQEKMQYYEYTRDKESINEKNP